MCNTITTYLSELLSEDSSLLLTSVFRLSWFPVFTVAVVN